MCCAEEVMIDPKRHSLFRPGIVMFLYLIKHSWNDLQMQFESLPSV